MFLLYFLHTDINKVIYLQRVPFFVFFNWCYLHQDPGKNYSEMSKWNHTWDIQHQPSAVIWKKYCRLSGYKKIIREDYQNFLFDKRENS